MINVMLNRLRIPPVVIYPTFADPRFISVTLLSGLALYALMTPAFGRHPLQLAVSVLTWVGVDALLLVFYQRVLLIPLSALVPSIAAFVLVDSPFVWPYAAVGTAAMLSKHFLRVDGRHVFNPLNFGLVVALLFFSDSVVLGMSRFGHSPWLFAWVLSLGALVAFRSERLDIAVAYTATFLVGASVRSLISGAPLLTTAASPATNIVFYMYAFHMMTDPKTTPDSRAHRVAFGILVGVVDAVLRRYAVVNAPLYALFVVLGLLPFFRKHEAVAGAFIWRLRTYRLAEGA